MTKAIPSIQRFMTTTPQTVDVDASIAEAQSLFSKLHIRHLPVVENGKLAGILTSRDVALLEALTSTSPRNLQVKDAMSDEVFSVAPDASLNDVAKEMAARKIGSVVVTQNQHIVGIFTTTDLAQAFVTLLETRLTH